VRKIATLLFTRRQKLIGLLEEKITVAAAPIALRRKLLKTLTSVAGAGVKQSDF
jgi:hypothetical protein